jgi:hypothetical protein
MPQQPPSQERAARPGWQPKLTKSLGGSVFRRHRPVGSGDEEESQRIAKESPLYDWLPTLKVIVWAALAVGVVDGSVSTGLTCGNLIRSGRFV